MEFPIFKKKAPFPEMREFEEILDLSGISLNPIGISIVLGEEYICSHSFDNEALVEADRI